MAMSVQGAAAVTLLPSCMNYALPELPELRQQLAPAPAARARRSSRLIESGVRCTRSKRVQQASQPA